MEFNQKEILDYIERETFKFHEQNVVNQIIDIYNGKYRNYEEYKKYIVEYNKKVIEERNNQLFNKNYKITYTPELILISEIAFNEARKRYYENKQK